MLRVFGQRLAQRVRNIEKRSLSSLHAQKPRHDNLQNYLKTDLFNRHVSSASKLTLLNNTNSNKPAKFVSNGTQVSKCISFSGRCYKTSSALLAKKHVTAEQKEVSTQKDKCDVLDKMKQDFFEDDPELRTTIVEMYEDFDDGGTPTGKIEKKDKKSDLEAKVEQGSEPIPYSLQDRFQVYRDSDAEIIMDEVDEMALQHENVVDDDKVPFSIYQQKKDDLAGLNLTRGIEGVFDVGELVNVLRKENAHDICVISIPPDLHYTDYMVIITALSTRHLKAMVEILRKVYKRKKEEDDKSLKLEGESCVDWKVLDMGNIVLHIFMPETRSRYDLETLWSVGPQYDDLTQRPPKDSVFEALQSHLEFLENMTPVNRHSAESNSSSKTLSQT